MPHIPEKLVIATGNPGKLREFQALLAELGIEVIPQSDFNVPSADETGLSFVENAIIKARNAAHYSGLPALADDSGIEVDALKGAPGIYSARYAGEGASDEENNQKLLTELAHIPEPARRARYQCVIAFLKHDTDPTPLISQGSWEGFITHGPRGSGGFGYDPLFRPADKACTAAELDAGEKNRISHRGQAIRAFYAAFLGQVNR